MVLLRPNCKAYLVQVDDATSEVCLIANNAHYLPKATRARWWSESISLRVEREA